MGECRNPPGKMKGKITRTSCKGGADKGTITEKGQENGDVKGRVVVRGNKNMKKKKKVDMGGKARRKAKKGGSHCKIYRRELVGNYISLREGIVRGRGHTH